jgi:hypothetical protein
MNLDRTRDLLKQADEKEQKTKDKIVDFDTLRIGADKIIVEVPVTITSIKLMKQSIDFDKPMIVDMIGKSVNQIIDVEVGDAVIIEAGQHQAVMINNKLYFIIYAHSIQLVYKQQFGSDYDIDRCITKYKEPKFADPNIESPALDHVKYD